MVQSLFENLKRRPLQTVYDWQKYRKFWLVIFVSGLFLELCALAFQYVLNLAPCELCVYQRLAVILIMIASLVIMLSPSRLPLRVVGYGVWVIAILYGLDSAIEQTGNYREFDPFSFTCSLEPVFLLNLPLDEWWPKMFKPTGICGADDWRFLMLNMAQWMVLIFSGYLAVVVICIASLFYGSAKKDN